MIEKIILEIQVIGNRNYKLIDEDGVEYQYSPQDLKTIEKALKLNKLLVNNNGIFEIFDNTSQIDTIQNNNIFQEILEVASKKPYDLVINDKFYQYLIRNILKAKNMMIVGPTGTGKTSLVYSVAKTLKRGFYKFPMNSSGDAKTMLIGSMAYSPDKGTYFKPSKFVEAIKEKNAIILLDEYTRCHPEAENILFSVLDHQRYLLIDEGDYKEEVKVAEGVCFIATANIGSSYTTTRVIDRATSDRFLMLETDYLSLNDETKLMVKRFMNVSYNDIHTICSIARDTRENVKSGNMDICLSTRKVNDIVEIISDGFNIRDAISLIALPMFYDGSDESDDKTTFIMIVEAYLGSINEEDRLDKLGDDNLFKRVNKGKTRK